MLVAGVEYVTSGQGAAELGVDVDIIYQWASRGLIRPAARLAGRPVYRLDELWDVERDTRKRGRPRSSNTSGRRDVRLHADGTPVPAAGLPPA